MPKIGLLLDRTTNFLPGPQLAELAQNIERLDFESVWLLDAFGREPFIAASFLLANTTKLMVGTGVATVYGRDPTSAAQALQTISELYPNRFFMGLGASNPAVIAKRKQEWVAPLPKMKAYLADMAEVGLAALKPETTAPLYIAAHAPGLQALAVQRTQGILTWMMPSAVVAQARERIGEQLELTAQILCVMSSDAGEARRIARAYLAMYLALPYYQDAFEHAGFDRAECTEGGGSDRLIDTVLAWGSPEDVMRRVTEFAEAGATRVVLNLLTSDPTKSGPDGAPEVTGDWNLSHLQDLAKAVHTHAG
jgi:probable F420-dependent oxidoreductase